MANISYHSVVSHIKGQEKDMLDENPSHYKKTVTYIIIKLCWLNLVYIYYRILAVFAQCLFALLTMVFKFVKFVAKASVWTAFDFLLNPANNTSINSIFCVSFLFR